MAGQVPYPFWALLFDSGELQQRLSSKGFDPEMARMLEEAFTEMLVNKQYEEEANYRYILQRIENLQTQIDALDTRVTALEP